MNLKYIINNGFYIPIISYYFFNYDYFLFYVITIKLFITNHYISFAKFYDNKYIYFKSLIRLTDTGHIASIIYYFYPDFLPIAFNVHFIISIGYWLTVVLFDLKEMDDSKNIEINKFACRLACICNHSVPLSYLFYKVLYLDNINVYFDTLTLYYSFLWCYVWFIFIYTPWRFITGDPVYSVLSNDKPFCFSFSIILIMHMILFCGNFIGQLSQSTLYELENKY
tara:strand:- start:1927 stop:2598 length:672 start_codon:yes stop_codon:yes gene_type:complete